MSRYLSGECNCQDYAVILKLATKYQMEALRSRVIDILQWIYPDTLDGYDTVRKAGESYPTTHPLHRLKLDDVAGHVAVINAAREAGAAVLLRFQS